MAVHKVPQDVEAEDKFLGPLTFKQFLFGGGVLVFGYLTYITIAAGGWFVSFIFAIPALIFAALAFPWSKEQPTELWLAAQIRFRIKPRKRIWDQSGMKELVTITAPIQVAHAYSDGLTQGEVRNRLSALATMVDSRGWAVKNVRPDEPESDRLVSAPTEFNTNIAVVESTPDILDESSSTIAKQFDSMIEKSEQEHKSATLKLVEEARARVAKDAQISIVADEAPAKTPKSIKKHRKHNSEDNTGQNPDFWFMHQQDQPADPTLATFQASTVVAPGESNPVQPVTTTTATDLTDEELLNTVHKKHARDALQTRSIHEKVIDPNGPQDEEKEITKQEQAQAPMTPPYNPDIMNLAQSNDLSVQTLQHLSSKKKDLDDGEVVVPLR